MRFQRRGGVVVALGVVGLCLLAAGLTIAFRSPSDRHAHLESARQALPPNSYETGAFTVAEVRALEHEQAARARSRPRRPRLREDEMPDPVRILIPAIGVSAHVIPLGLNADRSLEVPESFATVGWFERGPEPGEPGPAVLVGHVDSRSGPGVFYHLPALEPHDAIEIVLKGGAIARYIVTSHISAPKDDFPARLVYGGSAKPRLRLITCGGEFDPSTGHYVDNYIVFAKFDGLHRSR